MVWVILICFGMVVITTLGQFEVFRQLSNILPRINVHKHFKVLIVVFSCFFSHIVQIYLYALAIYLMSYKLGLGEINNHQIGNLRELFYFSAETFTSLGYGDMLPTGHMRLLSGVETLNGLLLIGWSASFTYISMEQFWKMKEKRPHKGQQKAALPLQMSEPPATLYKTEQD